MSLKRTPFSTEADQPTTKKGFWGRLWGKAKRFASTFPVVAIVMEIGEEVFGGDWNGDGVGRNIAIDLDGLTDIDSEKVSNWDLAVFSPFFEALLLETKDIFDVKDLKVQIELANQVLNKICTVKSHYSRNTLNFSANAQSVVTGYIADSLLPIEIYINAQFDKDLRFVKKQTFTPIEILNLGNIIAGNQIKSISCNLYVNKSTDNNPVIAEEIVVTASNTGQPIVETTGVVTNTTPTKSNYTLPLIVIGFLALVLSLSKKSKKNN